MVAVSSFGGGEVVLRRTRPQMGPQSIPQYSPWYFLPGYYENLREDVKNLSVSSGASVGRLSVSSFFEP